MNEQYVVITPCVGGGLCFYNEPTYVSDNYFSGVNIVTKYREHIREEDVYLFEGSIVDLFKGIKARRNGENVIYLRDYIRGAEAKMMVFDDYCTLIDRMGRPHSIKLKFDKGVKIAPDVELIYSPDLNAYRVTTRESRCRQNKYVMRIPTGESYDRIISVLKNGSYTTQELACMLDDTENRISGRLSELFASGVVTKDGRKKMVDTGKSTTVWSLVR